jgi:hypothetical protein
LGKSCDHRRFCDDRITEILSPFGRNGRMN